MGRTATLPTASPLLRAMLIPATAGSDGQPQCVGAVPLQAPNAPQARLASPPCSGPAAQLYAATCEPHSGWPPVYSMEPPIGAARAWQLQVGWQLPSQVPSAEFPAQLSSIELMLSLPVSMRLRPLYVPWR